MSDDGEKRKDAGDTVREGVRSVIGILGALKDAIEESFEDLRAGGEQPADGSAEGSAERAPQAEAAAEGVRSTFQAAQDAVEDVRERLDFVTRREFDALASELAELRAQVEASDAAGRASSRNQQAGPAAPSSAQAAHEMGAGGAPDESGEGPDFRFEVE